MFLMERPIAPALFFVYRPESTTPITVSHRNPQGS